MKLIPTNKEGIYRDPSSKSLVINDEQARIEFMQRREEKQKIQAEINTLKVTVKDLQDSIQKELGEFKELLMNHLSCQRK